MEKSAHFSTFLEKLHLHLVSPLMPLLLKSAHENICTFSTSLEKLHLHLVSPLMPLLLKSAHENICTFSTFWSQHASSPGVPYNAHRHTAHSHQWCFSLFIRLWCQALQKQRGKSKSPLHPPPPPPLFFYPSVSVLTFLVGFPWRTPRACWPAWTGFHGERWWECCGCHHAVWNTHIMTGMLLRNQTNLRSETRTWSKNSTIYYPKVQTTHVMVTALQSRNTIKQPNSKTLAVVEATLPTLYHASTNREFWAASRLSTSAFQEHHD